MPNPLLTRAISPNNTLPSSKFTTLSFIVPFEDNLIVGSSFPRNIAKFREANLNIGVDIGLDPTYQNIDATSTIAVYIDVQYFVFDPTSTRFGRWNLAFDPAYTLASPSPLYDGKDPLLQNAFTLVPSSGDNHFATSINLLNRRTNNGTDEIDDASELLLETGYFIVRPYYEFLDSRDSKGAGVTNAEVWALRALTVFALVTTPTYIT